MKLLRIVIFAVILVLGGTGCTMAVELKGRAVEEQEIKDQGVFRVFMVSGRTAMDLYKKFKSKVLVDMKNKVILLLDLPMDI